MADAVSAVTGVRLGKRTLSISIMAESQLRFSTRQQMKLCALWHLKNRARLPMLAALKLKRGANDSFEPTAKQPTVNCSRLSACQWTSVRWMLPADRVRV